MDDERLRGRSVVIETLLALTVLAFAAAQLLTQRPRGMIDVPNVTPVAVVPESADVAKLTRFVDMWAIRMPKVRVVSLADGIVPKAPETEPPLRLGYSVREFSFLGVPFYGYRDLGFVLYSETPDYFRIVPLDENGLALLERETGSRLHDGFVFPFWKFYWGWLFIAAFAAIGMMAWRNVAKRRAALGIM